MSWEDILKISRGVDKRLVDYIMSDRQPRTIDKLYDDIYDHVDESKKLGGRLCKKLYIREGRPTNTRFDTPRKTVSMYLTNSSDYIKKPTTKRMEPRSEKLYEFIYIGGN